jgi:hypothetical protein
VWDFSFYGFAAFTLLMIDRATQKLREIWDLGIGVIGEAGAEEV